MMNKYTSLIILIAVFLMAGCMEREMSRYNCDEFITPWAHSAYVGDGMVKWKITRRESYTYYKIPDGDICRKETWDIESNDLHLFEGE